MSTAKKTIKIPVNYDFIPDLAFSTGVTIGNPIINIIENTAAHPVTITAANLFVAVQDMAAATSIGDFRAYCQLTGSTIATIQGMSGGTWNTGENWGGIIGPLDFTNHFISGFTATGESHPCLVQLFIYNVGGSNLPIRSYYSWFEITYTYDTTETKRMQTICVPYESLVGTLSIISGSTNYTLYNLTGTVGILSGYTSPVICNRWLELKGNFGANGGGTTTVDANIWWNIDSGSTKGFPLRESGLASDTWGLYQGNLQGLSTTATHDLRIWSSLVSRWPGLIVNEWITFYYTVVGTHEMVNYIEFPIEYDSPIAGTTSANTHRFVRTFKILEPYNTGGTITLLAMAAEVQYYTTAATTLNMKGKDQAAYRAYANAAGAGASGAFGFQHGLDGRSAGGKAISGFTRGDNTIYLDLFRSTAATIPVTNVTGVIRLLYSSGVAVNGGVDGNVKPVFARTKAFQFGSTAGVGIEDLATGEVTIPESQYFLRSLFLEYCLWMAPATASRPTPLMVQARVLTGEGAGNGWRELLTDNICTLAELGYGDWRIRMRDEFKKYPRDPDTDMLDVQTTRTFRTTQATIAATSIARYGHKLASFYSTLYHTVSGTVSGSANGTVTLDLYDTHGNLWDTTGRTGNGTYSFIVYDDTELYYVAASESTTLKGLSKEATPGTGFDINLTLPITGYGGG